LRISIISCDKKIRYTATNVERKGITWFPLKRRKPIVKIKLPNSLTIVNKKYRFENFKRDNSRDLKSELKIRMLIKPKKRGKKA
jgi:hypothetical protein